MGCAEAAEWADQPGKRRCKGAVGVLWGRRSAAGHVVAIAADDPRIAAVAQVPWFGDPHTPGQTLGSCLR